MHANRTFLLPASTTELERMLRAAAAGGLPEAIDGTRPPVLAIGPLLQARAREAPAKAAPLLKRPGRRRAVAATGR